MAPNLGAPFSWSAQSAPTSMAKGRAKAVSNLGDLLQEAYENG
jgi:hypothetical protein